MLMITMTSFLTVLSNNQSVWQGLNILLLCTKRHGCAICNIALGHNLIKLLGMQHVLFCKEPYSGLWDTGQEKWKPDSE